MAEKEMTTENRKFMKEKITSLTTYTKVVYRTQNHTFSFIAIGLKNNAFTYK